MSAAGAHRARLQAHVLEFSVDTALNQRTDDPRFRQRYRAPAV